MGCRSDDIRRQAFLGDLPLSEVLKIARELRGIEFYVVEMIPTPSRFVYHPKCQLLRMPCLTFFDPSFRKMRVIRDFSRPVETSSACFSPIPPCRSSASSRRWPMKHRCPLTNAPPPTRIISHPWRPPPINVDIMARIPPIPRCAWRLVPPAVIQWTSSTI